MYLEAFLAMYHYTNNIIPKFKEFVYRPVGSKREPKTWESLLTQKEKPINVKFFSLPPTKIAPVDVKYPL